MTAHRAQVELYASAARTTTPTAVTFDAGTAASLHLVIDVTAATATPSVVPTIDAYDALSGKWYNMLTGLAITATGTTVLKVGRGIAAVANAAAADALPGHLRLTMTHADSDSITYTAAAHLLG